MVRKSNSIIQNTFTAKNARIISLFVYFIVILSFDMVFASIAWKNNNAWTMIQSNGNITSLTNELYLLYLSIIFGSLGASVHGLVTLITWDNKIQLARTYFLWYLTRPLMESAL